MSGGVGERNTKKHAIFDFDGVVCDSVEVCINCFNRIRDEHFLQLPRIVSKSDLVRLYAGSLKTSLRTWLTAEESETFFNLHSAAMAREEASLKTYAGIATAMAVLGPGRCSVVTSAYSKAVWAILERDPSFDQRCIYVVAGRELHQSKTDKIHDILARLGITGEDAIYIGDLESDILYCRQVPIDIIAVGYGYHPAAYLAEKGATYVVETVAELAPLLAQLLGINSNAQEASQSTRGGYALPIPSKAANCVSPPAPRKAHGLG